MAWNIICFCWTLIMGMNERCNDGTTVAFITWKKQELNARIHLFWNFADPHRVTVQGTQSITKQVNWSFTQVGLLETNKSLNKVRFQDHQFKLYVSTS